MSSDARCVLSDSLLWVPGPKLPRSVSKQALTYPDTVSDEDEGNVTRALMKFHLYLAISEGDAVRYESFRRFGDVRFGSISTCRRCACYVCSTPIAAERSESRRAQND